MDDIRSWLPKHLIKSKSRRISLADNNKVVNSNEIVELRMTIQGCNGAMEAISDFFVVINMKDNDVILGLGTILSKLWNFFKVNIEAKAKLSMSQNGSPSLCYLKSEDLLESWSVPTDEEEPEEVDSPLPVQFEHAISFLGKTKQEAIDEYYSMMHTHVSGVMKEQTDILNFLKTKAQAVFIPENWSGISGIEPLHIDFHPDMPSRIKPKPRPINPRLWEAASKEFERLKGYFYEPSRSPWASCLVIAPKATKPFIRFCGDYSGINKWIPTGHFAIPIIRHELDRIAGYSIFADIDLTNAFHQVPLHADTKQRLSIQTPWGQYQPKFMPEGIGPGSAVLQETVHKLFNDFEWAISIFDNVLILGKDAKDLSEKLNIFVDRCLKHNVVLKFAKSWIGFDSVEFFGYRCKHNGIELTEDRKKAILDIPFPTGGNRTKQIRSLLGCGVMFVPFISNYADLVKNLTDMTKASFNWDKPETWKHNYREQFENYKQGLQSACAVFYPNYELDWILRTDASDYGAGAVLLQVMEQTNREPVLQPIAFWSPKFSEQASKWPTIEKEGYGIYAAVKKFSYYLVGKHFIVETDHNNLKWMEASLVPKIVRWRYICNHSHFRLDILKGQQIP